jgi:hypothetical protein
MLHYPQTPPYDTLSKGTTPYKSTKAITFNNPYPKNPTPPEYRVRLALRKKQGGFSGSFEGESFIP